MLSCWRLRLFFLLWHKQNWFAIFDALICCIDSEKNHSVEKGQCCFAVTIQKCVECFDKQQSIFLRGGLRTDVVILVFVPQDDFDSAVWCPKKSKWKCRRHCGVFGEVIRRQVWSLLLHGRVRSELIWWHVRGAWWHCSSHLSTRSVISPNACQTACESFVATIFTIIGQTALNSSNKAQSPTLQPQAFPQPLVIQIIFFPDAKDGPICWWKTFKFTNHLSFYVCILSSP